MNQNPKKISIYTLIMIGMIFAFSHCKYEGDEQKRNLKSSEKDVYNVARKVNKIKNNNIYSYRTTKTQQIYIQDLSSINSGLI